MTKIDTPIDLILNIMTTQQAQDNISQIPEKQLILTTDKNIPIPSTADANKTISVDQYGGYILKSPDLYGASIQMSIDSSTYVITTTLKDQNGDTLGQPQTIDLPLESVVVSGSYDSANKKVILTLKNGSTIDFSVADLVSGLATTTEVNAKYTKPSTGIPASDLASAVQTNLTNASTALQPNDNVSQLTNDAGYLTTHQDISGKADKPSISKNTSATSVTQQLATNTSYRYTQNLSSLTISFPTMTDDYESEVVFKSGATATTFTCNATIKWSGDEVTDNVFTPAANKTYTIEFWCDSINLNAVVRGV